MNHKNLRVALIVVLAVMLTITIVEAQGPKPILPKPKAPTVNAGTAFTYQGQLKKNGALVNGSCNLTFDLFADVNASVHVIGPMYGFPNPVNVTNGLFTVQVDFGSGAIQGDARWVLTSVKCGSDSSFTGLSLQQLMPAPMALALPGLYTQQNETSPNVIGGYSGNQVDGGVYGATISGGGTTSDINHVTGPYGTIGGGAGNISTNQYATVGGGYQNEAEYQYATVSGGHGNVVWTIGGTIGGGESNVAYSYATVGGGMHDRAGGTGATVGGGQNNNALGNGATIGGGIDNVAIFPLSTVGGGRLNIANESFSTIPGGLGASATHYGEMAYASGQFATSGDAQTSLYVLRNSTSDATPTELFLNGTDADLRITIAPTRTLSFEILVTARSSVGESAGYRIWGIIKNVGGTTSMVGASGEVLGNDGAFGSAIAAADTVNNALVVKVTGATGKTVRWVAVVKTVEVAY